MKFFTILEVGHIGIVLEVGYFVKFFTILEVASLCEIFHNSRGSLVRSIRIGSTRGSLAIVKYFTILEKLLEVA